MERNREIWKTSFKILEYMSSGVPFVSSLGEYRSIINMGKYSFHSEEDWVKNINSLLSSRKREQIGQNGYRTMVEKFSYSAVYKNPKIFY